MLFGEIEATSRVIRIIIDGGGKIFIYRSFQVISFNKFAIFFIKKIASDVMMVLSFHILLTHLNES